MLGGGSGGSVGFGKGEGMDVWLRLCFVVCVSP